MEWERAAEPIRLQHVAIPSPPFVGGARRLTISRDDQMRLGLVVEGVLKDPDEIARRRAVDRDQAAGTFLPPVNAMLQLGPGESISVTAHLDEIPEMTYSGSGRVEFTQRGDLIRFCQRWAQKRVALDGEQDLSLVPLGIEAWRADWFINGPQGTVYRRRTRRQSRAQFTRNREDENIEIHEPLGRGSNLDYLAVVSGDLRFRICEVPKEFSPEWTRPTAIEFLSPIPEASTREAVAEIVSFVFGRRLMQVGSSLFDSSGWTIEEEVISPWGQGIQALCARPDVSPFVLDFPEEPELLLSHLVSKYVANRELYCLKDALLTYWLANESFLGVDLALYGSAVEALKNAWFKSTKSKSRGIHMPQEEFTELLGDLFVTVRERLSSKGAPAAIIARKMAGAYSKGSAEQLETFFDEIGLPVGDVERAAIKARNAPAHGGLKSGADPRVLIQHGHAYRILFERAFLKILDYDGPYVDRTSLGFPRRPLNEPCAGTNAP